jgi:hypothetical protein
MNSISLVAPFAQSKSNGLTPLQMKVRAATAEFAQAVAQRLRTLVVDLEAVSDQIDNAGVETPISLYGADDALEKLAKAVEEWAPDLKTEVAA